MLFHLLPQLADLHGVFNVFVYITFRAAGAVVTSLLIAFLLGPVIIRRLAQAKVGQVVRTSGPATHQAKAGTPTMGGLIMIGATVVSTVFWADLTNWYTVVALYKMIGQWSFGLALGAFLVLNPISPHPTTWTTVPFFSDLAAVFAPPVFVVFAAWVVSGASNAVNLTDGIDGLAAGLVAISA